MPKGSKFARTSYALFSVAVLLALLKLGGITGTKPLFLRVAPATPVAKAAEPGFTKDERRNEILDLPDADGPAPKPAGRSTDRPASRSAGEERGEAPIFYRPSSGKWNSDDEPVCRNLGDSPKSSRVVFPLPEDYFDSYEDSWGAAHPQGGHEGTDLMSPTGTPEFALTDGTLVPVKRANGNGWNRLGGYTTMLQAAHDAGPTRKGDLFYYAHMDEEGALPIGTEIRAGQQIGVVGDTGEGREVTRGKFPPHLHFGWYDASGSEERTNLESGAMNPYPLLLWLEAYGGEISGGTDASYCEASQESVPKPTGASADLDTGDPQDARPSPIVGKGRDDQGSPERESSANDGSGAESGRAGATGATPEAGSAGETKKEDGAEDGRDGDQISPSSDGDGSPRASVWQEVQSRSPGSSQPSYASVPVETSGEAKGKERRDGRDAANVWDSKEHDEPSRRPGRGKITERRSDSSSETAGADGHQRCAVQQGESSAERYVSVTRAKDPATGRRAPIKYGEWLRVARKDPELRMSRGENTGLALWTGHPARKEVRLDLCGGNVMVESPDEPTVEKMRGIASALDAKVRGDDGEDR